MRTMGSTWFVLTGVSFSLCVNYNNKTDALVSSVFRTPLEAAGRYEFVVCTAKAIDQGGIVRQLEPVVDNDTTIVIIQNGVGNEDPFREAYPKCTILTCVVRWDPDSHCHSIQSPRHQADRHDPIDLGLRNSNLTRDSPPLQTRKHRDRFIPERLTTYSRRGCTP